MHEKREYDCIKFIEEYTSLLVQKMKNCQSQVELTLKNLEELKQTQDLHSSLFKDTNFEENLDIQQTGDRAMYFFNANV